LFNWLLSWLWMVRGLKTSNILVWIQSININWWFSRNVSKVSNPRNNCLSQSWVEIILASWPQFRYSRVKRLLRVSSFFRLFLKNANTLLESREYFCLIPLNRTELLSSFCLFQRFKFTDTLFSHSNTLYRLWNYNMISPMRLGR